MKSRNGVATALDIPEATLRAWEQMGWLPEFDESIAEQYEAMAAVIKASRRAGVAPRKVRLALGAGTPRKEREMGVEPFVGWMLIDIFEGGRPIVERKARVLKLWPYWLEAQGVPVAIAASERLSLAGTDDGGFWGHGTRYDFRNEAIVCGLQHPRLKWPEVDLVDRGGARKPKANLAAREGGETTGNLTLDTIEARAHNLVSNSGGKMDMVSARHEVLTADPLLYGRYRALQAVRNGGGGDGAND